MAPYDVWQHCMGTHAQCRASHRAATVRGPVITQGITACLLTPVNSPPPLAKCSRAPCRRASYKCFY